MVYLVEATLSPKKRLMQDAFDYEMQIRASGIKFSQAAGLSLWGCLSIHGSCKLNHRPVITYSDDPIFEMFRLMKSPLRVCANTEADSVRIGGDFTIPEYQRQGSMTQEESVMSLFTGSLLSLIDYSVQDSIECDTKEKNDQESFLYEDGVLERRILHSTGLYSRIPMSLFDDYWNDTEGFKSFIEYLEIKYSENKFKLVEDFDFKIGMYTIPCLDRRNKTVDEIDYMRLRFDTERQITKMLHNAVHYGYEAIVITIPGSGMFSNITGDPISEKDSVYLDKVEEATIAAVSKYGKCFKEIVICGHRTNPSLRIKN